VLLLICDDCDDVMSPQWYRYCAACAHDFGSGVEPSSTSAETEASLRWPSYVLTALVVGVAALVIYFAWLFATKG
jgi:hypothetical protein